MYRPYRSLAFGDWVSFHVNGFCVQMRSFLDGGSSGNCFQRFIVDASGVGRGFGARHHPLVPVATSSDLTRSDFKNSAPCKSLEDEVEVGCQRLDALERRQHANVYPAFSVHLEEEKSVSVDRENRPPNTPVGEGKSL